MKDIMLDIETLGQGAGCVVLSIGAQVFNPASGEIGEEFYTEISIESCKRFGLLTDPATVSWWDKQPEIAKAVVTRCKSGGVPLDEALYAFNRWILEKCGKLACVWGNGSDFDNAIMAFAYKVAGVQPAWQWWNNRCFRTLKALCPLVLEPRRQGTHHNALDDAKHQVEHALKIFAWFAGSEPKQPPKKAEPAPTKRALEDAHLYDDEGDLIDAADEDDDEDLIG